mmetsp:Transcript_7211/g.10612  ORF Transcript_7211/g.10612 Transcript_7211/m.10612 type:complete len:292 (-) Transcript_7211:33-908(-)|eukprot:CAMPEP_0117420198 /NCGR_PEP_ID=MMETSP0758-20121206/1580_1 /TAXON_ID=63605 /ORGANISM="Percolomonas cosmopolitus, Strain AE-1 (ATCC 50343)" /LENGTH=291 /DNA_ID=CAMNT_0005201663 /DNA_START=6 /DNA_END=881 /DNA_ORIENTATION=-
MLTKDQIRSFEQDGLLVIPNFLDATTCRALKERIASIVQTQFVEEQGASFSASKENQDANCNTYFLKSTENISFFEEKHADKSLPSLNRLNKIAHALHLCDPLFNKVSYDDRILEIIKQLMDYKEPAIMQSMYILKPPKIGGEVEPHQDASFLQMKDQKPCLGFWFAIDDAHKDNACLWGWKGSHKKKLSKLWVRTKQSSSIFEDHMEMKALTKDDLWDKKAYQDNYEPLEVSSGSLVLIHGNVLHQSYPNKSDQSRHAYTFHVADRSTWLPTNWIQRTDHFKQSLFSTKH